MLVHSSTTADKSTLGGTAYTVLPPVRLRAFTHSGAPNPYGRSSCMMHVDFLLNDS